MRRNHSSGFAGLQSARWRRPGPGGRNRNSSSFQIRNEATNGVGGLRRDLPSGNDLLQHLFQIVRGGRWPRLAEVYVPVVDATAIHHFLAGPSRHEYRHLWCNLNAGHLNQCMLGIT